MPTQAMDLMKLMDNFHTEEKCREALVEIRWPDGVRCPRCDGGRHAYDSARFVWDCYSCGYQFSVLAGTIFHDTKLPLRKWFMAVLLMVEARKGISANQMKRTIGVSYKTAWYLCHRIRAAMGNVAMDRLLSGTVEVDETYIGGKRNDGKGSKNTRGPQADKAIVIGAVERDGEIRLQVINKTDRKTLHGFIRSVTDGETVAIYTDQHSAYVGIGDANTLHESVNHSKDEWIRGDVHTQTVESVWSLLKRSIVGSYHQLSFEHLSAYLAEMEWRYNNRDNPYLFRDTMLALINSEKLPYADLVG